MIDALFSTILEVFFAGTGRRLFKLFGQKPPEIISMFTGMAVWIALGILWFAVLR
ncbi:MAG: hypothetical protein OJF48_002470 [Afipia sp.]|jgi:hypothetical protein|nr:MAG: hypothetical protein OJF48_002470 [Afipia sp.]